MSSTRSPSRREPATELVIVSHGSPSDPEPQEEFIKGLAQAVGELTGGLVRGATLAAKGSLATALEGLNAPLIYPHFMADGWFVSTNLPKRLDEARASNWTMLPPFGLDPDLPRLALSRAKARMADAGLPMGATTLVIAAHGSPSDPRPARATERFAAAMAEGSAFRDIRIGYVDEAPSLEDAATVDGPALVLPFFAARAGHVLMDVPQALEAAQFEGPVLPPIGTWDDVPALIASAAAQAELAT